jgi:hypothetical protein
MEKNKIGKYLKYAMGEIFLVVIGILIALSINNWNNTIIDSGVEQNILKEIANGLKEDLTDVHHNMAGHKKGLTSCDYWNKLINDEQVAVDSVSYHYWYLTRNFAVLQNTSSFESLKSRGLELISNDSLRLQIISLYEIEYYQIKTIEEKYDESQFQKNYFKVINHIVSPHLVFNSEGDMQSIQTPLNLTQNDTKEFLSYLWKIKKNREEVLKYYSDVEQKIKQLQMHINETITNG